ncbi:ATP-binding cassette domain-containing protein [Paenibacillus sp. IB182496]|uniref:ATP-binding cassette domain-containing protein n=1 Tax=Paenibacillus sabuli TaxID=2772509 RepID=A0A927BV52_9BACL|nr:ABC transporter ATP-binding protein [Paenibacillus sabuli]MBD2846907.1 ATP-binding cassette domain-containing protein [Paenibacillus sabuli]
MRKLFVFLKPYRLAAAAALALMLIELVVELVHPLLMAKVIDDGIVAGDRDAVLAWGAAMIGVALLGFAAGMINSFFSAQVSQGFGHDVRRAAFAKLQSLSYAAFNRFPTASLITRLTSDVTQLQNVVFMGLRIMARAPLLMAGGLTMALLINVRLALVTLCVTPLLLGLLVWVMRRGFGLFKQVQAGLDGANGVLRENLVGMRLIRAFVRSAHETRRFTRASEDLMTRTISALRLVELTLPLLLLVMNLSILYILWVGQAWIGAGGQLGDVVAIINYTLRITGAFSIISLILTGVSRARASGGRLAEVLEAEGDDSPAATQPVEDGHAVVPAAEHAGATPGSAPAAAQGEAGLRPPGEAHAPGVEHASGEGHAPGEAQAPDEAQAPGDPAHAAAEHPEHREDEAAPGAASAAAPRAAVSRAVASAPDATAAPGAVPRGPRVTAGSLAFTDVTFRYPDTAEPALQGITFEVPAGATVAVLGATGSGKSSLFQLIPRLYEADAGRIEIDGIDIRRYAPEALRGAIGYVPQESLLFSGTVADNIRWGAASATDAEVALAARRAQIHDTILRLPQQYDTMLGQKGVNLSGGQKQRLSVARALLRRPRLLLLDDSTSALDAHTEARLLAGIAELNGTTLVITQKIATAQRADSILLLGDGRLLGAGTHAELLRTSPLYARIVESQMKEEVSAT